MSDDPERALEVLRIAVGAGLPTVAGPGDEPPAITRQLLFEAQMQRVEGLVWLALERGVVTADEALREWAREAHLAALRRCLLAEAWAFDALAALDAAGVETRALKGLAIAHLDHADPAERVFADADLLIRRADHAAAVRCLTAAGFTRAEPPVRMWWERRYGKAVLMKSPTGGELDVHLAITGGQFGRLIDHEALWAATPDTFDLGGRTTLALPAEARWLHACCHVVLGGHSGLRAVRDVAQLVLVSRCDWQAAVRQATQWHVEVVLAEAVCRAWGELRLDPAHSCAEWAATYVPDAREQAALAGYREAAERGWGAEGRTMLRVLGPLDRALFLAGLALPQGEHRRHHGRSLWQHVQRRTAMARKPT